MGNVEIIDKEQVKELETDLANIKGRANSLVVDSDSKYQLGAETLTWIQMAVKKCEERRKFFVKPLQDHVSRINLFFKNFSEPLSKFRDEIQTKMLKYRNEQEIIRQKEEARIRKEQAKISKKTGQELPAVAIPEAQKTTFSEIGSVTAKKVWVWDVVNFNQIPKECLCVDEKVVNAMVRGGVRQIRGLKIYQKETLAVK